MKIKIKWKPFIGLLSPPFSYPPYLPLTPLFQRPPQNQICLREAGTHYWNHCCWIFDTVIKIIIIESSPPHFLGAKIQIWWLLPQNWQLFSLWTLLHFIIITTMQLWKRTEIYKYYLALKLPEKNTHTPPHYCLLTKV